MRLLLSLVVLLCYGCQTVQASQYLERNRLYVCYLGPPPRLIGYDDVLQCHEFEKFMEALREKQLRELSARTSS